MQSISESNEHSAYSVSWSNIQFEPINTHLKCKSFHTHCNVFTLNVWILLYELQQVYTYLGYTGFLSFSVFTAVDTLLSPALSDHFGFSIVYISYFFLGIMMIAFCASLVL